MILSEFLKEYRKGVNVATGKAFSLRMLAELLEIDQFRLQKWEQRNNLPSSDSDRNKLKAFFEIEDFEDIKESTLKKAIKDYPSKSTGIKLSTPKEVIHFGKEHPTRLTAEQYAASYGDWLGVPMYNAPITASFVESYRDESIYKPQYFLHDPRFKDCDFGAIITGDSMHGEIRHGDFVALKEIFERSFIVFGDIYYIVTDELETCKYINADPKSDDNLLLVPHNKSISPSPVPKQLIKRLYKVRGVVRGY